MHVATYVYERAHTLPVNEGHVCAGMHMCLHATSKCSMECRVLPTVEGLLCTSRPVSFTGAPFPPFHRESALIIQSANLSLRGTGDRRGGQPLSSVGGLCRCPAAKDSLDSRVGGMMDGSL